MAPGLLTNDSTGDVAVAKATAYQYSKHWLRQPRPMKIIVIGCGVSGIAAVKMFKDRFKGQPLEMVIYEKNESVGGTWFENRYPG
jgi:ribulose 1,5-bisphosphate synthetase/thiazole synthase